MKRPNGKSGGEKERKTWETVTCFLNPRVVGDGKRVLEFPRGNPGVGDPRDWVEIGSVRNGNPGVQTPGSGGKKSETSQTRGIGKRVTSGETGEREAQGGGFPCIFCGKYATCPPP